MFSSAYTQCLMCKPINELMKKKAESFNGTGHCFIFYCARYEYKGSLLLLRQLPKGQSFVKCNIYKNNSLSILDLRGNWKFKLFGPFLTIRKPR